jgi:hypothetical protein
MVISNAAAEGFRDRFRQLLQRPEPVCSTSVS